MSAVITTNIPAQAFEVIRDQVAVILLLELQKQYTLDATKPNISKVFVERWVPVDGGTEPFVVNVKLHKAQYENKTVRGVTGIYTYYVDVHTAAKASDTDTGDVQAKKTANRLMGNIRAILFASEYVRLGFAPGFISRVMPEGFVNGDNMSVLDALSDVICRMTLTVVAAEDVHVNNNLAVPLLINTTVEKIEDTDLGFYYQYNPPQS